MKCVVVAAMARELAPTVRALDATRRGDAWIAEPLTFVVGGIGVPRATRAAEQAVREGSPEALVSTGLAGAIDPALRTGDLVIGGTAGIEPSTQLLALARRAAPKAQL